MSERSVHHATIAIERRFAATPARVFHAWSDPVARARWELPGSGWVSDDFQRDFRVGGIEVATFGPPGGPMFTANSRYEHIVTDRRIIFSYSMGTGGKRGSVSLTTVELLPDGLGTRLIFTEQAAFLDDSDTPANREQGWRGMIDKLAVELERVDAPA